MRSKSKIRVAIADDSIFMRRTLKKLIEQDPHLEVVGVASNGRELIENVHDWNPDVITLDIEMPILSGLPTLHYLMKHAPTRILIVSAHTEEQARLTLQALEFGAMDVLLKPQKNLAENITEFGGSLRRKIKELRVADPLHAGLHITPSKRKQPPAPPIGGEYGVIVIGGSTGSIVALEEILPALSENLNCIVILAIHIPDSFSKIIQESFDRLTLSPVHVLNHHDKLKKGHVYLLHGGVETTFVQEKGAILSNITQSNNNASDHSPSINKCMKDIARLYGKNTLGVLLTGMGTDGVEGLRWIKKMGGETIAESEQTALINGMPQAARDAGVVDKVLRIENIVNEMMNFLIRLPDVGRKGQVA